MLSKFSIYNLNMRLDHDSDIELLKEYKLKQAFIHYISQNFDDCKGSKALYDKVMKYSVRNK